MRYIVLDTNCLLQILPSTSPFHKIWTDILFGKISLCVSTSILEEYEEVLGKKITPDFANQILETITHLSTTTYQNSYVSFNLIYSDPDDNKFVDCAIASNAEYIVSNDKHYNVLKNIQWPKIKVVNVVEFTKQLA